MTEAALALVPVYGVWLILLALPLSCLALPVPSSILVMAAGGFAASGDLVLWQVQLAAFAGFALGDQLSFAVARRAGQAAIDRRFATGRLAPTVKRARAMLARHGALAVLLSRTVVSPLGPYTGYLSGALGMDWGRYTVAALAGAAIWTAAYSLLGYAFAGQIGQIAAIIGNASGFILAGGVALGLGAYLWRSYRLAAQAGVAG